MKLNTSGKIKLAIVSALGLVVTAASAQIVTSNSSQNLGVSIRAGVFLPSTISGETIGHDWLTGGLDYRIKAGNAFTVSNTYTGVSADYYAKAGNSAIPIVITENSVSGRMTSTFGIGIEDSQFSGEHSTIRLTTQLAYSYDLSKGSLPVFLQAKYFFSPHSEFTGLAVFLGARF